MKAKELRLLTDSELREKLKDLQKQRMELEFKRQSYTEKPHLFKVTKKDIARILTILNERIKLKK
ncbi:MAG: 50S ribosomal protein L29 [Candidatus Omnitrophica bacterium]|nr:50S ribosomal protein L29 [Candidatus Omnitrophota bacterium]MCM8831449.1 50S ribosomal protein L29 [Candidatus Omnitrophota bacterium]